MAEYVQQTLEEMTNEVLQLERVGLFEQNEIKRIIAKRKRFEYKLRRRIRSKEDFLNYIHYEAQVLALIKIRRKENGYNHKRAEIEGAILKRILSLFHMLCRSWPTSAELWIAYIKFVQTKTKNKPLTSKLYNRMLQIITNQPNLWVMAAKYEFECVYSIESARHILLKAISLNKQSTDLWHEYFRLELLFVDSVKKRDVLEKINGLSSIEIPKYAESGLLGDDVKEGQIARSVYKHAQQAIPDDLKFSLRFVDIVKVFDWAKAIEDHIFADLFTKFESQPVLWEKKAMRIIDEFNESTKDNSLEKLEKICSKLMKKMFAVTQSAEAWSCYLSVFWHVYSEKMTPQTIEKFLMHLTLADNKGHMSEHWMMKWVDLMKSTSSKDSVVSLYEKAVKCFPRSEALWIMYLEYLISVDQSDVNTCLNIFNRARQSLKTASINLWNLITDIFIVSGNYEQTKQLFETAAVADTQVAGIMKEKYMHWLFCQKGIKSTRKLYKRLIKTSPVTANLYMTYLHMEECQPRTDVERIRTAYRSLLEEYGSSSVDAWLQVINCEKSLGDIGHADVTYHQAIKSLRGSLVQDFIRQSVLPASKTDQ